MVDVFHDVVGSVPEWFVATGIAVASLVVVAFVFVVGARLFPERTKRTRRVSGEGKRRREIREYLRTIGEAFAEDYPLGGHRVAFYLPERDVAVTFDARTYYRLRGSPTYAVLVEHELPGASLGVRLPFETPPLDTSEVDPASAAFAVLGLSVEASAADVRSAYREKVKQAHPDHGGSHDDFRRVREAYTTAKEHTNHTNYSTPDTS